MVNKVMILMVLIKKKRRLDVIMDIIINRSTMIRNSFMYGKLYHNKPEMVTVILNEMNIFVNSNRPLSTIFFIYSFIVS